MPGIGKVLKFKDPKGTTIELFSEWSYLGTHHQVIGVGPFKFGHVAFIVDDAEKITEFYTKVLGFRVSDWVEDFFSFLRCGPDHHTVNFLTGKKTQMHHIAFEVKDFAQIQNACELFGQKRSRSSGDRCVTDRATMSPPITTIPTITSSSSIPSSTR